MTWQPIETAPKNGERLILWVPKTNKGIVIGKWSERMITHDHSLEAWWLEGFDLPFHKEPYLPTLWQHLPAQPCIRCGDTKKVLIFSETAWAHEEQPCPVCSKEGDAK